MNNSVGCNLEISLLTRFRVAILALECLSEKIIGNQPETLATGDEFLKYIESFDEEQQKLGVEIERQRNRLLQNGLAVPDEWLTFPNTTAWEVVSRDSDKMIRINDATVSRWKAISQAIEVRVRRLKHDPAVRGNSATEHPSQEAQTVATGNNVPAPKLPVVRSDKTGDYIEYRDTPYPVSESWAKAFRAMLAERGKPTGIGKYIGKVPAAIKRLHPTLGELVKKHGNAGYYLSVFDTPDVG